MPTGYTAQLEGMDFDARRWLAETVPRAFGVCVSMRDDGLNLTREQILKKLEEELDHNYHSKAIASATAELEEAKKLTKADWERKMKASNSRQASEARKRLAEKAAKKVKYLAALADLKELQKKATTEFEKNVVKYGIEQLEMVADEYEPSDYDKPELPEDVEEYKRATLARLRDNIAYNRKHLQEDTARIKERMKLYKEWLAFVDKHLTEKAKA